MFRQQIECSPQSRDAYRNDNPSRHYPLSMDLMALRHWRLNMRCHLMIGNWHLIEPRLRHRNADIHTKINRRAYLQSRRKVERNLP